MIMGSIQQEDITFVNIYAPNTGALKYIKQLLANIQGELDSNTIIVGNLNTPLQWTQDSERKSITKHWP